MRRKPRLLIKCACGCGGVLTDLDSEGRLRTFINGHNGRKYTDPTQHKREWNHRNRPARAQYKLEYHRKRKVKLLLLLGGKCEDCHLTYSGKNACIFHFHHRSGADKLFAIGNQVTNKSWSTLVKEAQKCSLLCANCHEMCHSAEF